MCVEDPGLVSPGSSLIERKDMIPKEFGERMKKMLPQEEYEAFIQSYDKERYQSLRFNPLKGERENFLQIS